MKYTESQVFQLLVDQGGPSVMNTDEYEGCAYRAEGGLKCAAGWQIPDEKYVPEIEGTDAEDVFKALGLEFEEWVMRAQAAHDTAYEQQIYYRDDVGEPREWKELLAEQWQKQGLGFPEDEGANT